MKRLVVFLILVLTGGLLAKGSDKIYEDLNQAKIFYDQKNYLLARERYLTVLSQGVKAKEIYYNLGNVYYRLGDLGYSRFYYELAREISPRDSDVNFNLKFIRQQIKEPPLPWTEELSGILTGWGNRNEIFLMCLVVYLGLSIGLVFYFLKKWPVLKTINWILIGLWLVLVVIFLLKMKEEVWTKWGITIANPVTEVRNGPGQQNSVALTISAARKVIILGEENDWLAVGLPAEGLKAWIAKKDILVLN